MLNLNPWNLLFTVINILVLVALFKKFLFKPVNAVMEQRKEMIDKQYEAAKTKEEAAEEVKKQYEASLAAAEEERAEIIKEAKVSAKAERERILKSADVQAEKIIDDAEKAAEMEQKKALQNMETEIASMAVMVAGKILEQQGSAEGNDALYNQFLTKAGERSGRNN